MTDLRSFDDVVDAAINELRGGADIAAILAHYPQHAPALGPLLETAALTGTATATPPSDRLAANFAVLEASLAEARRSYAPVKRVLWSPRAFAASVSETVTRALSDVDRRVQWAPRRLAFASLSLPALAIAALAVGAGGAAAAALVADDPAFVRILANAVTPDWAVHIGPDDQPGSEGRPPASSVETPAPFVPGSGPGTTAVPISTATTTTTAPQRAAKTASVGESGTSTPPAKNPKEKTPGNDHEKSATPGPGDGGASPPSATPGKSGDAPGHATTTPEATRTPKSESTPNNGNNGNNGNGNGRPATSTPEASDDDHGNSGNDNGSGNGNGNGNGNNDP